MVTNQGWFCSAGNMGKSGDIFGCQRGEMRRRRMPLSQSTGQRHGADPHDRVIWFKISTAPRLRNCYITLSSFPSLKCKALQNIAQFPFQTKFPSPCRYPIDQEKMTYSWIPNIFFTFHLTNLAFTIILSSRNISSTHPLPTPHRQNATYASSMNLFQFALSPSSPSIYYYSLHCNW